MIHLKLRTEYSFQQVYGPIAKVLDAAGGSAAAITDRGGTWGHAAWDKLCRKRGVKPIFGVELGCVRDPSSREAQPLNWMVFLAKSGGGLVEINRLVERASAKEHFYYHPRIGYDWLHDISDDIAVISGANPIWGCLPNRENIYLELSPACQPTALRIAAERDMKVIACGDNFYPKPTDRGVYEVLVGRNRTNRTKPMHIIEEWEWMQEWNHPDALANAEALAAECTATLRKAQLPKFKTSRTLLQWCQEGAKNRRIDLRNPTYKARLERELGLIREKDFEDYFFIIADLVQYAKQHMLVGPARGSSCGSLVCYLLGITDIDPIPYGLLFERFIDINRKDLPDIDIDFQDTRRDMVFRYLQEKYGEENVGRLGTILRYKAKSAIGLVSKEFRLPFAAITDLKGSIIERSGGDSRASFCVMDTLNELEIGRKCLAEFPQLAIAGQIEAHASTTGTHAAGVCITSEPIVNFCSIDHNKGVVQVDKFDAEALNLLKIDALGLRTLSVLQDCLDQVGWTREQLLAHPLDDQAAFDVLNRGRWAGIFQFEGFALQSLTRQMHVDDFEDIASLTALARPGPLASGGATEYVKRRTGKEPVVYLHPLVEDITKVSYGIVIYQEQVMEIARKVGKLSWEDVSSLRKAMSKSLGKEFFDGYKARFLEGAKEQKVKEADAIRIWENINTMGSWSFNRSHAVAYGMVSYWCLVLKARHPLEFAAAVLRNSGSEEATMKMLRELHKEGVPYKLFDPRWSTDNWSAESGQLVGGFNTLHGIGAAKAKKMMEQREAGKEWTAAQLDLFEEGRSPFSNLFEGHTRFKHIYDAPQDYIARDIATGQLPPIIDIADIPDDFEGELVVIAKLKEKNPRDLNELQLVQKRGGRVMNGQTKYLNLQLVDDSGDLFATIGRFDYLKLGVQIMEEWKDNEWGIWRGTIQPGFKKLQVKRFRRAPEAK